MNNQLKLKRVVNGEYCPQYWTMSGGEFDAMLTAVKGLAFRQWQDSEKVWLVRMDGVKALRETGYTVEKDQDVRVELLHGQQSLVDCGDHVEAEIVLNYRRASGDWAVTPVATPTFSNIVSFTFEAEQINLVAREIRESTETYISDMDSYARRGAILRLTNEALRELDRAAVARYKQVIGKRSAEEYKAAIKAVWQAME
jgi:hypothetical protein